MRESTAATEMRTMTAGQDERARSNGQSRALKIEALQAAANAKKRTIPISPKFASKNRPSRRNLHLDPCTPVRPVRRIVVDQARPFTPSLHTLERARQRNSNFPASIGQTHRYDDPFSPAPVKFNRPEFTPTAGLMRHSTSFTCYTGMTRALHQRYQLSISTNKGSESVKDLLFHPQLIQHLNKSSKKKKGAKDAGGDQSDHSENEAMRAYKKQ